MLGLVVMLGLGCSSEGDEPSSLRIRDSTGAGFDWVCHAEGCEVEAVEGSPPLPACAPGLMPAFLGNPGRFFMVRGTCVMGDGADELVDERILACDLDDDCPETFEGDAYECRAGLCQSADHETYPPEAVPSWAEIFRLCRAESDWYSPLEMGLFDQVDAACPEGREEACQEVPAECAQP